MDAIQILSAFAEDGALVEEVLGYINHGMFDEWDCDLWSGVKDLGFGGDELAIASKAGLILAKYHRDHPDKP